MGNKRSKKRIAVFTTYFHPHIGGYEKNVEELFSRIAKRENYEVDVVCFNTEKVDNFEKKNRLTIYRIDCWSILGGTYALPKIKSLLKIKKEIDKNKYIAVSTQTRFFISSFLGFLFAKKNKAKLIHTERGTSFVKQGNLIVRTIAYSIDQTMGRIIISNADVVTGVSKKACEFTRKLGAKNPIKIFNGINIDLWKRNKNIEKKSEKIVITFVGRIIKAKGIQDLLKVINKLDNQKNLKVQIVGDGNYLEGLKDLSKKLNLKNINFLGKKNYKEVVDILSGTDIFVNPSYTEGLPTSVIEAGACGCAIIASDVGGTSEIINHNKDGYIFRPKNINNLKELLEDLLKSEKKRKFFGKKISTKIKKKFDWGKVVEEYLIEIEK
jgi:glycosyltransferase involved in cell wall biosynthesis